MVSTDVKLALVLIIITLSIGFACTFLPPSKSYYKGFVIMFSIITLGYFCVYIEKPTKEDFSIVESLAQNTNTLIAEIFTKHLQSDTSALCKALECQPGDILEYQPGEEDDTDE